MPRLDNKIAIVDIETTGPNISDGDRIIQIGAIIISNGTIVNTYSMLINPDRDIPDHIVKLTGIEAKDVANAPKFQSVASLWYERLKDCVFVAHNLGFDLRILKESFAKFDLDFSPVALDSVILSKILVPKAKGFNLTDLSNHFNFDYKEAHDALSDALITADIINQLARMVPQIPINTLDSMKRFIKHMNHDELLFFNHPERFILNTELHDYLEPKRSTVNKDENKYETTMAEFIQDEWSRQAHLIIEDLDRPLEKSIIFNQIKQNKNENYIISFPNLKALNFWNDYMEKHLGLDIAILKSKQHYLNLNKFEDFLQHYNFEKSNQQELMIIAATIHWLSYSEFADYSELNKELSIKSLLNKHEYIDSNYSTHQNFERARNHAMKQAVLLTNDLNLLSLVHQENDLTEFIFDRKLIIMDLSSLYQSSQHFMRSPIEISGLISFVMSTYDELNQLYSRGELTNSINRLLQSIRDQTNAIIKLVSDLMDEQMNHKPSHIQDELELYIDVESMQAVEILSLLKDIRSKLNNLKTIIENEKDYLKLISYRLSIMHGFINKLDDITRSINKESFSVINARSINNKYYNITYTKKPVVITKEDSNWLNRFNHTLLVSPGNYYQQELSGISTWLKLNESHKYIKLPSTKHIPSSIIHFPIEYLQEVKEKDRLKDLVEFVSTEKEKMPSRLIILLPNQELVVNSYKTFIQNEDLAEDYHIFAQSVTGSMNRIRRRVQEADQSIVIILEKTFTKLFWGENFEETTVILYNLPFNSPDNVEVKAQFDYMTKIQPYFQLFDDLLLPQMSHRLKELIHYTSEYFSKYHFYLFDSRIYSKYYSKTVNESIAPMIEIVIE